MWRRQPQHWDLAFIAFCDECSNFRRKNQGLETSECRGGGPTGFWAERLEAQRLFKFPCAVLAVVMPLLSSWTQDNDPSTPGFTTLTLISALVMNVLHFFQSKWSSKKTKLESLITFPTNHACRSCTCLKGLFYHFKCVKLRINVCSTVLLQLFFNVPLHFN